MCNVVHEVLLTKLTPNYQVMQMAAQITLQAQDPMMNSRVADFQRRGRQEPEEPVDNSKEEIMLFLNGKDEMVMDYYRQTIQDKNNVSCQFYLKSDGTWKRSDDNQTGIWWLKKEGQEQIVMINYSSSRADFWNSGNSKGSRKFVLRTTNNVHWFECIEPSWFPTTKMIVSGTQTPWKNHFPDENDERNPEDKYSDQVQMLKEMGFQNAEKVVKALDQTQGDIQKAIQLLTKS